MKNIVCIGNTAASQHVIELLLAKDPALSLTLISADQFLPYSRESLLKFLGKEIKEKQVFLRPDQFYKDNRVKVITGQAIARFNCKKNQVVLENKDQLAYDILILSDLAQPRLGELKGQHKKGIYHPLRLSAVRDIIDQLPFVQTMVVQVNTLLGFLTMCALSRYAKEVIVCSTQEKFLTDLLDDESSSMLKQLIEYQGIRLMMGNALEEILGDSDVKAVRLKSGKVLSTEMVVLDEWNCDARLLKDAGILTSDNLGSGFQTNISGVYWMDAVRRSFAHDPEEHYAVLDDQAQRDGQSIVAQILGDETPEAASEICLSFKINELTGCVFGKTREAHDIKSVSYFDAEHNVFKKLFVKDDRLEGGVIVNAPEDAEKLFQIYKSRSSIQGFDGFDGTASVASVSDTSVIEQR